MKLSKSIVVRLLIAAVCVAATQAAVWRVQHQWGLLAAQTAEIDVERMPLQLGPWSGSATEVDRRLFESVGATSMVNRLYEDSRGRHAAVHLACYPFEDLGAGHPPHRPPDCSIVAGWTVLKDDWQTDDHNGRYRFMLTERQGTRCATSYWYQLGPDVVSNREEIRKVLQALRMESKPRPSMVKVLIQMPVDYSDADAKSVAEDLGERIYGWILSNS